MHFQSPGICEERVAGGRSGDLCQGDQHQVRHCMSLANQQAKREADPYEEADVCGKSAKIRKKEKKQSIDANLQSN